MDFELLTREEAAEIIMQLPEEEQPAALEMALQIYGEAPPPSEIERFAPYRFIPETYIKDCLGWEPWPGTDDKPGQIQIINAYTLALQQQLERRDFEKGEIKEADLKYWKPGQTIKNYIRVEAGHTTGKTKTESGLVNHFLDCFPSVTMMYGPSQDSLKDNLWQELLVDRRGKKLPGRIFDSMEIRLGDNHYAKCRVTSDSHGTGSERLQGKHGEYLLFILDEAEGIPDFVFEAIDSMASGGIVIVIMVANPKTRTSKFHKMKGVSNVKSFRMSCLHHPNVREGKEVVPGAVRRHYVEMMLEKHCEVVTEHNEEAQTFILEFPVKTKDGRILPPGTIFKPNFEFMFRVLGVAPPNMSEKTIVQLGNYEAALKRELSGKDPFKARFGIDCARWGIDSGTFYIRHAGGIRKAAEFPQQDTFIYKNKIKTEALKLAKGGVTSLHVRVDGGGGFGGGIVDLLRADKELRGAFPDYKVYEIAYNGDPYNKTKYDDLITEMFFETAEVIKGLRIYDCPDVLEIELTEREYEYVTSEDDELRKIESKKLFKKRKKLNKSPDDGDGFVMAAAPDFCFTKGDTKPDSRLFGAGGDKENIFSH